MKKAKVLRYSPYYYTIAKDNIVYTLDRDILATAKNEIKKFEDELKMKNLLYIKEKRGKYYRYWIVF